MGEVLLVYEIRPESAEVAPEKLEQLVRDNLPDIIKMQNDPEYKPLFFGIVGIVAQFIIPEIDGAPDQLEAAFESIEEISSFEMTFVTRL